MDASMPAMLHACDLVEHPAWAAWADALFETYRNEASASRGIAHIAPNLFIGSRRNGYFHYSRHAKVLLVYAYTGPQDGFDAMAAELLAHCRGKGYLLHFLSPVPIGRIADVAFSATPFGVVQRLEDLASFSLKGGAMQRLRYQVGGFQKAGRCTTAEYICGTDPAVAADIVRVIDAWCSKKTKVNPLVRTAREEILAGTLHPRHRLFLTRVDDTLQNVVLISPLSAQENGYLMDLEFYGEDMPRGGLEFAITRIIDILSQEGRSVLSMGGTYGCRIEASPTADPVVEALLDDLHKQEIFNDQGNFQFKNKFRPVNRSIYLCRPADAGRADSVIDIIMMIADPARSQTSDVENHTPLASLPAPGQHTTATVAVIEDPLVQADSLPEWPRLGALRDAGFNPLALADADVPFDAKSDSWAQVHSDAKAARLHGLHASLQQPVDVDDMLGEVFPFDAFVLTESGRSAEEAFYRAWPGRGEVLQNIVFPTNLAHQIASGFTPREYPVTGFCTAGDAAGRGDIDIERLSRRLDGEGAPVAMVFIELANNAAGGISVSLEHVRTVRALLEPHGIPLVLDATRILENVRLAQRAGWREQDDMWQLVREWLALSDAAIVSLAKDFGVDRGGLVCLRDATLYAAVRDEARRQGTELDMMDRKRVALALRERHGLKRWVDARIDAVRRLGSLLDTHDVPYVHPTGGHCVLVDPARLEPFGAAVDPSAAFCAWLYLAAGVRAGRHSVGMQRGRGVRGLVRIALPLGMTERTMDDLLRAVDTACATIVNVPVLSETATTQGFGDATARYSLEGFRRVDASAWTHGEAVPSTAVPCDDGATVEPADDLVTIAPTECASDIAIVGIAGRYPKAHDVRQLWKNLRAGLDCITPLPDDRVERRLRYGPVTSYRGGFVDDIDRFDSLFFNIPPKDAERLDPQERLFVEVAWEALEDAGYHPDAIAASPGGNRVGVFVGAVWAMYQTLGAEERHAGNDVAPNSFLWSIANRVSYALNFSGPSLTVDTACSSSLTALYLACEAIRHGECASALVGGVNLDLHQSKWDINRSGGALSPDGVCRSFGHGANGYVAGEGVGAVFIKPLAQALADGDQVYGVIKGIAINHGGRTSGFVVPNPKAQTQLVRDALARAGVPAESIGYIEAHGTGTELGDPLEIAALNAAFRDAGVPAGACAVGSLKSNIGHLEAAAGIAGLTKVLLQMRHRELVPSLHSAVLNEHIDFRQSSFRVQQALQDWQPMRADLPLRAGISSFGAGGANAHVVVEGVTPTARTRPGTGEASRVFPISARTEGQRLDAVRRLRDFLRTEGGHAPLADIAYTLQVGRKAFEHRVAVVASSVDELVTRLEAFLAGSRHAAVAVGSGKTADPVLRLMSRDERREVTALLASRADAGKLARLWADGLLADWRDVADTVNGRRVSLPTYPFADKRHWVPEPAVARPAAPGAQALHPLIDANESTFARQVFRKTFHASEFVIRDHKVMDVPTLPGVAYLELARKAGELAAGMPVRLLRNILWVSPIAVRTAPHEARVELLPGPDGVAFEVYSQNAEGTRILHSQGKIGYTPSSLGADLPLHVDLEAIRARCHRVGGSDDVYPRFRDLGLDLGTSFRSLQEVYRGDGEALGLLRLPATRHGDLAQVLLHPSLIDGALQAGVAAELIAGDARMLVPFSIGEVEILAPLGETCWAWVTEVVDAKSARSAVSRKNVTVLDEAGNVLVRIREATGVPIADVHKNGAGGDGVATHGYQPRWEDTPLEADAGSREVTGGTLLLVGDEPALAGALATLWPGVVATLQPGDAFIQLGPQAFQARLDVAEQIDRVLDAGLPAMVVTLGTPDNDQAAVEGIFGLYQALSRRRFERPVRLVHGLCRADTLACPRQQAIVGLLRSLALENARLHGAVLEWHAPSGGEGFARALLAEKATTDSWIRYVDGVRQVSRLARIELTPPAADATPIRRGGTWLVTGGAGGIGLIFAQWLATTHAARVVLMGRSPPPAALEACFAAWREAGGDGMYVQGDVADSAAVHRCVAEARQRFGMLGGVIHAAGILRDGYLRQATRRDFDAVCSPKVDGTLLLDEATATDPLEWFVLCSSMAALGGNAGQTAYAYANHFMDDFASAREAARQAGARQGRALSVNWSLWAEGGMRLDEATQRMFLDTLGIAPLPSRHALDAFAGLLAAGASQAAVVEGVRDRIELAWGIRKRARPAPSANAAADVAPVVAGDLTDQVRTALQGIAMGMLKLAEDEISTDSVLLDLGFDSIGLTGYANAINDAYGVEVTPVLFFDYPSIGDVAGYLCLECAARVAAVHGRPAASSTSAPAPAAPSLAAEPIFSKAVLANGAVAPQPPQTAPSGNRFRDRPIAIVGMAGVMPGSDDLEAFWRHLDQGDDLISVIPRDRWDWEDFFGDPFKEKNRSNSKWGGFMNEVDKFDPLFFGISRREAQMMDPQQRIFLETVWKAVEDSGHKVSDLAGTRTGLFVGVATNDYVDVMNRHDIDLDGYSASGNSHSVLANRISFLLNLRGPSAPIDTACSSSLVALHRAIESIHTGSCDMAIVGGVQVMLSPGAYISFGMAGMLSNDGRCKTFDKRADGYVRGEGAGAILIKPLDRAEADGDHIYAVVRATAENHGGRVTTLTAPNSNAQAELLIDAYTKAEVSPADVGYVECHGTGTGLGDPIEIQALKKAFGELYARHGLPRAEAPHCGLSSAKTNIGHLETAAGIAGILRALLAMRAGRVPANVHFQELNPYIDLTGSPFYIPGRSVDWASPLHAGSRSPRVAGVSSFGFGGANAHVVLEEYLPAARVQAQAQAQAGNHVFPLSARDDERLADYLQRMLDHVERDTSVDIARVAHTLQVGRDPMSSRIAVVASSRDELIAAWRAALAGTAWPSVYRGKVSAEGKASEVAPGSSAAVLAQAWVAGAPVDWNVHRQDRAPGRLPLPTYPFARERCWLPGVDGFRRRRGEGGPGDAERVIGPATPPMAEPLATVVSAPVWQPVVPTGTAAHAGTRHILVLAGGLSALTTAWPSTTVRLADDIDGDEARRYGAWTLACLALAREASTPGLIQVLADEAIGSLAEGLEGMLRTIGHERSGTRAQLVIVPHGSAASDVAAWLDTAAGESAQVLLRVSATGEWRARRHVPIDGTLRPLLPAYREHGVYLITGGLGGLGLLVARDILTRTRHARVVLAGRSTPEGARRERWNAIVREAEGRASWLQWNLEDAGQVNECVATLVAQAGRLDGVVHAAGMTADGRLADKDADVVQRVLAPKVRGTLHLDQATRHLDLDFFVAFSSIVGSLGNPGQFDYAAANGFLDAYAARRHADGARGWRSIAWPLWKDGGMQVPPSVQAAIAVRTGMQAIPAAAGLQALYDCVGGSAPRTLVMFGRPDALRATLEAASHATATPVAAEVFSDTRIDEVRRTVLGVLTDTLLVPASDIDPGRNLSDYGLDSIGVANLFRGLNRALDVDLAPSSIFEYPTLDALAGLIAGMRVDAPTSVPAIAPFVDDGMEMEEIVFEVDDPAETTGIVDDSATPSSVDPMTLLEAVLWREGDEEGEYERLTF
jgi:acyl transferase domain-containing protein/tryptophanase/NAD(P)-dependent dehydrogenase (short-subunit alcohol dehydrogenase family)/acyl carrier protein